MAKKDGESSGAPAGADETTHEDKEFDTTNRYMLRTHVAAQVYAHTRGAGHVGSLDLARQAVRDANWLLLALSEEPAPVEAPKA